ncbi:hypothetical protein J437_LFUL002036 [Ladona fulva]|uniref:Uncharacterized protein n=1 Tax=Ladona fulva TaxID=123851 RepID=A0A8K0JVB3_LADFU|nr:hypothetical protein J437_LFUL002036 [Ladona fulva]
MAAGHPETAREGRTTGPDARGSNLDADNNAVEVGEEAKEADNGNTKVNDQTAPPFYHVF